MALASYDWVEASANVARYCGTEEVTAPCTHHLNPLENNIHEFTAGPQVMESPFGGMLSAVHWSRSNPTHYDPTNQHPPPTFHLSRMA